MRFGTFQNNFNLFQLHELSPVPTNGVADHTLCLKPAAPPELRPVWSRPLGEADERIVGEMHACEARCGESDVRAFQTLKFVYSS